MATTTTYEKYGIYQNTSSTDVSDPSTLDNLVLETNIPLPVPKPNEVLIRVKAVALNYRDLIVIAHSPLYPVQAAKGLTPCVDGAGIVEQVGSSVTNWKPGDRILILPAGSLTEDTPDAPLDVHTSFGAGSTNGVLSQYLTLNEKLVTRFPEHLTFDEAAATISVGASAANALFSTPGISLSPGKIVVTQGTGGVSSTAIQFASAEGCIVIATSSSDEKLKIAKSLGATHLINYKTHPEWAAEVLRLTNDRGADLVVDVGGASTIEESIKATTRDGVIVCVGFLGKPERKILVEDIIFRGLIIRGMLGYTRRNADKGWDVIREHKLKPVIEHVYDWNDAKSAFIKLRAQSAVGKIVIRV